MANVPDHNKPEVVESEIKVFTQNYYVVDDDEDTGRREGYKLNTARIEVLGDANGVVIESVEECVREAISIPTPDLALKVAEYINFVYAPMAPPEPPTPQVSEVARALSQEDTRAICHELWRLSNHITSPHGPVDPSGAAELMKHINYLEQVLRVLRAPHPDYSNMDDNYAYKPVYQYHI
jgi:hypothetical protein